VEEKIIELIESASNKFKYVQGNNSLKLSFYEMDDLDEVKKKMDENNTIILKDIKALELKEANYQKKFFHLLEEVTLQKKIIFVCGNKQDIDYFFEFDEELRNTSFPFTIEEEVLGVQDVYQEVLSNVDKDGKLDDKFKLEILDYITNTYEKRDCDYPSYRDKLCRELLLNGKVPEVKEAKTIDEIFADLNELVGLDKVKKTLHELVDYMSLREKNKDLKLNNVNLHMVFLGNPGTGKTTVARLIVDILYNLGYIKQNKLIEVSVKDLVAEYVGQTAPKVMGVVERAMGGILFIDEAYALAAKDGQNSYNAEAIATLIKAMEDYRDNLVVIFAGYTKEMQAFLNTNSGIVSRVGYTLEFDDYTTEELIEIFNGMMKKSGFKVSDDAIERLREVIEEYRHTENFGNARFVRNVYEKTIIKHASNTKNKTSKKSLKTISAEDISTDELLKM
jgi:AAA+ superfamily predicted ATPase